MHNKKMFSLAHSLKIDSPHTAFSVSTGIVRSVSAQLNCPVELTSLEPPSWFSFRLPGQDYPTHQLFASELAHCLTNQFSVSIVNTEGIEGEEGDDIEITVFILVPIVQAAPPVRVTIPEPLFSNNYMFP